MMLCMAEGRESVRVRPGVVDDADAIGVIHGASWASAYVHIFDSSFLVSASESRRTGWRNSLSRVLAPPSLFLVAELHGELRAFAHATPASEAERVAEVRAFFAHPEVWG